MFWVALALCFWMGEVKGLEETFSIESGEVQYIGSTLALSQGVCLEHPLGKLMAQEAILTPPSPEKKTEIGTLDLSKQVKLQLKEGGQLTCAQAHLDAETQRGTFQSSLEDPFVVYMENCREKGSEARLPLVVKSQRMDVWIDKALVGNAPHHYLRQMHAVGNVTVDYNHDFIVHADQGQCERIGAGLASQIHLSATESTGSCRVTNRSGDLILSRAIDIDTEKRSIAFQAPTGTFQALRGEHKPERLDFSADELVWEDCDNAFYLRGHVRLQQKGMGTLTTEETLKVVQRVIEKKKQLQSIESTGMTQLKSETHCLTCHGKVFVDHIQLMATFESPSEGPQVFFENERGQIHADRAQLYYALADKGIVPQKVILEGNVKIENTQAAAVQYALSDRVEYLPSSLEMQLLSSQGNRVLFYDKANDLQVSAPGIKIKRDPVTQKDAIKGIGNVRFSLIEREFEQLREKFSLKGEKEKEKES